MKNSWKTTFLTVLISAGMFPATAHASTPSAADGGNGLSAISCAAEKKFNKLNTSGTLCIERDGSKVRPVVRYFNISGKSQAYRPKVLRIWGMGGLVDQPCLNPTADPWWLVLAAAKSSSCVGDWVYAGASPSYVTGIVKDLRSDVENSFTTAWI
ncbi:hypothetical protein GT755_30350 [Herbidospora sp. NEAU-GS84]|uniref:Secreted protein n=1 Tax=Herbidospora solisilvae TaxID=2696284 RepID=A0A7C9J6L9_9ACTN|nr:hypothetical protein [Herbidospora solisilvae]NAS25966.1 hypothetical protein [Herbidospora solisilvae]